MGVVVKIGAEVISLLGNIEQQQALAVAFRSQSQWIFETAFSSCTHIGYLHPSLERYIRRYIREIPIFEKLSSFRERDFSFSLSDTFIKQRKAHQADCINLILLLTIPILDTALLLNQTIIGYFDWYILPSLITILFLSISIENNFSEDKFTSLLNIYPFLNRERVSKSGLQKILFIYLRLLAFFLPFKLSLFSIQMLFGVFAMIISLWWESLFEIIRSIFKLKKQPLKNIFMSLLYVSKLFFYIPVCLIKTPFYIFEIFPILTKELLNSISKFTQEYKENKLYKKNANIFITCISTLIIGFYVFDSLSEIKKEIILQILSFSLPVFVLIAFARSIAQVILWIQDFRGFQKFKKMSFPQKISCEYLYGQCLSFPKIAEKKYYIESVRKMRIPLSGEITEPPKSLLKHPEVKEELAKLREQWYGLSS
ncbi:MAG: hypothetical protein AAGD25_14475 [Cyanobacteria bacterium P01_F01_bin.150]